MLEGRYARLEPLDAARHGDGLYEAVSGPEAAQLHRGLPDQVPASRAEFSAWLIAKAASDDPLFYAVIDRMTGRVEGRQSLMDINTDHGSAEIGHILWGPRIARTRVATEAFFDGNGAATPATDPRGVRLSVSATSSRASSATTW